MKAYSQDLRDRAIDLHENTDYSKRKISKLLKIGYQTLSEWIRRYKQTGDYSSKQHLVEGRKAQFTNKEVIIDYITGVTHFLIFHIQISFPNRLYNLPDLQRSIISF